MMNSPAPVSTHLPIAPQTSDDPLSQYTLNLLRMRPSVAPIDDILLEMEAMAAEQNIPIVGPVEGAIVQSFVASTTAPRRVLEIGTAIGYSTIWLARSLQPGSEVISIEIDPKRVEIAKAFVRRAGLEDRVTILEGDFFDLLPSLKGQFDVIFQDVIKHLYFETSNQLAMDMLDSCLKLLRPNGMLLGDNAFCLGDVLLSADDHVSNRVSGIQAYNLALAQCTELESVIIPIRDGLWVSYKRSS